MTQTLNPLYGDYINDVTVAKSAALRPGFLVAPTFTQAPSGADVAVSLIPDADLGFWAWKTRWIKNQGAFTFLEDATVTVTSLDATANPYQLLVARWEWTSGPLDVNGHPTGTFQPGMHALYGFEAATAGDMVQGLIQSSILQPDTNGRYGVVLGTLNHGVFAFQSATFIDLAYMSGKQTDTIQVDAALANASPAPYGTLPTAATITGTSSKLAVTGNTGMAVTFTAQKACSVILGGSHFAYGGDDSNSGGGSDGYILEVLKNGTQVKKTTIWLSNAPVGATLDLDLIQSISGSSGVQLSSNIAFPMTVVGLSTGDTLEILFNDRSSFYHWINLNWIWRMSLAVS
jgi:hypothetical protein